MDLVSDSNKMNEWMNELWCVHVSVSETLFMIHVCISLFSSLLWFDDRKGITAYIFTVAGPMAWNSPPYYIQDQTSSTLQTGSGVYSNNSSASSALGVLTILCYINLRINLLL